MPDTTYLHIQGRESDPTRVIALPGTAVRVGRGSQCEIRLPGEGLAEVQCLLRLRGDTWQIQPVGPSDGLFVDGEIVDHLRPLPFGATLQIGEYYLILRPAEWGKHKPQVEVDARFRLTRPVEPRASLTGSNTLSRVGAPKLSATSNEAEAERLQRWQARLEHRERWLQKRTEGKKWEARWKAAGEGIRSKAVSSPITPSTPQRSAEESRSSQPGPSRSLRANIPTAADFAPSIAQILPQSGPKPRSLPAIEIVQPSAQIERTQPLSLMFISPTEPVAKLPSDHLFDFDMTVEWGGVSDELQPGPVLDVSAAEPVEFTHFQASDEPLVEIETQFDPRIEAEVPVEIESEIELETIVELESLAVCGSEPSVAIEPVACFESLLPIERSIKIEAERSDPVWASPEAFATETTTPTTLSLVWREETRVTESVPSPEEPVRKVVPRRPEPVPSASIPTSAPSSTVQSPLIRDEFPSASSIFAAQGSRITNVVPSTKRKLKPRPVPTDSRRPEEWALPAWLGFPPVALVSLGILGVGVILAVLWTKDNMQAGTVCLAAMRGEKTLVAPIDPTIHPSTTWWQTTPTHLAQWAVAIERSTESKDRAAEVDESLNAAHRASPLRQEVAFALARPKPGKTTFALGLSRDVVTLTLAGRSLKLAGKPELALAAYRRAMALAAEADCDRLDAPSFDDDPQVRRYRLRHEAMIQVVARDMSEAGEWTFADWSKVVSNRPLARLAVARFLREKASADADKMFDLVLADDSVLPDTTALRAENLAARAEALAFKERRQEAVEVYREAIALGYDDATKRRWRLGLAEILSALGASKERAEMLELAKGSNPTEEVTRRALDAQKLAGLK